MLCGVIQGHEMMSYSRWMWRVLQKNAMLRCRWRQRECCKCRNAECEMRWRAAMLFVLCLWTVKGRLSWMKLDFLQCCVLLLYFMWLHFSRGAQQKYKIQKYFSLRPIFSCTQKVPTGFSYKLLVWRTHVSWRVWR